MVSVIIPALNEARAIGDTIAEVKGTFGAARIVDFEIVVVNDGSSDETAEIARAHGARVISHVYNLGYGRSLKDGIITARYDTIVIIDADGTYPIGRLPDLMGLFEQGYDLVVGRRQGEHYRESWLKRPLRGVLRFLVEFTAGQRIPDINSGMRVFSRKVVIPYFDQLCDTFSFTTSQTLAFLLTGKFVGYLEIDYYERIGTRKVKLLRDSLRTLQYIVQAALYYNPLKIFILLSLALGVVAIGCWISSVLLSRYDVGLLGIGVASLSVVVFALGLLADQIRQILIKIQYRNMDGTTVRGTMPVPLMRRAAND
jgi:glycosyltransferase involved in cell wall biosynthesis